MQRHNFQLVHPCSTLLEEVLCDDEGVLEEEEGVLEEDEEAAVLDDEEVLGLVVLGAVEMELESHRRQHARLASSYHRSVS